MVFIAVFSYNQQLEAINAVLNGKAELAMIDSLFLGNIENILENSKLEVKELIDNNQYYGIIVSGKAERLANCLDIYITTKRGEIERTLRAKFNSLWNVRILKFLAIVFFFLITECSTFI